MTLEEKYLYKLLQISSVERILDYKVIENMVEHGIK